MQVKVPAIAENVEFKGNEYYYVSKEGNPALAALSPRQGKVLTVDGSFAVVFGEEIHRHGEEIGKKTDIKFSGVFTDVFLS